MKEYKIAGRFTNENIQKALRSPGKATIVEAAVSTAVIFGVEYLASAAWDGTCWACKKLKNAFFGGKKKGGKK